MALENLSPIVREERLLAGEDLEPATRLEYFLKQAGSGGSRSVDYEPVLAETTKSVNEHGWSAGFSGGPIFEGTSYRVTVNGVTYEPLIGTAGDLSYICLGNTYVDDADPSGDYPFGIFYKNGELTAWLETGESITMQIDQIIQLVPVPSPAAADTGKVLTANNGAVEWANGGGGESGNFVRVYDTDEILSNSIPVTSDIDQTVVEYTSGRTCIALDYDSNLINCILVDSPVVSSPIAMIEEDDGYINVLLTYLMVTNIDDVKPFEPPVGADAAPRFYVKELLPNAKISYVQQTAGVYPNSVILIDVNYVTLGYGYTE